MLLDSVVTPLVNIPVRTSLDDFLVPNIFVMDDNFSLMKEGCLFFEHLVGQSVLEIKFC